MRYLSITFFLIFFASCALPAMANGPQLPSQKKPYVIVSFETCDKEQDEACKFEGSFHHFHDTFRRPGIIVEVHRFRFNGVHHAFREFLEALSFGAIGFSALDEDDQPLVKRADLAIFEGPATACLQTLSIETVVREKSRRELPEIPPLPFIVIGTDEPKCFVNRLHSERNSAVAVSMERDKPRGVFDLLDALLVAFEQSQSDVRRNPNLFRPVLLDFFGSRSFELPK